MPSPVSLTYAPGQLGAGAVQLFGFGSPSGEEALLSQPCLARWRIMPHSNSVRTRHLKHRIAHGGRGILLIEVEVDPECSRCLIVPRRSINERLIAIELARALAAEQQCFDGSAAAEPTVQRAPGPASEGRQGTKTAGVEVPLSASTKGIFCPPMVPRRARRTEVPLDIRQREWPAEASGEDEMVVGVKARSVIISAAPRIGPPSPSLPSSSIPTWQQPRLRLHYRPVVYLTHPAGVQKRQQP